MSEQRKPIEQWRVERYVLDELPADQRAAVEARLKTDPEAAAQVAALRESDATILDQYRSAPMAREIEARHKASPQKARGGRIWPAVLLPAVALLVLFAVIPRGEVTDVVGPGTQATGNEEVLLDKGLDPKIRVFRKGAGPEGEELTEGASADEGDVIQLKLQAAGRTHGVVVSVDGRGHVELHFPADERDPTTLKRKGTVALAHAYELDDAPDFERFFFVAARYPVAVADVLGAARKLASDPATAKTALLSLEDVDQATLTLSKVTP